MIDEGNNYESFLRYFAPCQLRLFAYIRAFVYDQAAANDVFQETSLALWRNFSKFDQQAEFAPWAIGIAKRQVMKYWRTQQRDRHVFSAQVLQQLTEEAQLVSDQLPERQAALNACLDELPHRQRELVQKFYGENVSASTIARQWERSVHTVYKSLKLLRRAMLECVERQLSKSTSSP